MDSMSTTRVWATQGGFSFSSPLFSIPPGFAFPDPPLMGWAVRIWGVFLLNDDCRLLLPLLPPPPSSALPVSPLFNLEMDNGFFLFSFYSEYVGLVAPGGGRKTFFFPNFYPLCFRTPPLFRPVRHQGGWVFVGGGFPPSLCPHDRRQPSVGGPREITSSSRLSLTLRSPFFDFCFFSGGGKGLSPPKGVLGGARWALAVSFLFSPPSRGSLALLSLGLYVVLVECRRWWVAGFPTFFFFFPSSPAVARKVGAAGGAAVPFSFSPPSGCVLLPSFFWCQRGGDWAKQSFSFVWFGPDMY